MHYLKRLITEIDSTHPNLGLLSAMCQISIKAKKTLLIVSPRGCGKSRASAFIGASLPGCSFQDRMSTAGLSVLEELLNDFASVIVVDDIAKTQTPYARISTICTLGELVYSHSVTSAMMGNNYDIKNFQGSAIINIQPVLLKELVKSDEWEASIQDKSIRYYHLYRPLKPNSSLPNFELNWGRPLDSVKPIIPSGSLADQIREIVSIQWGFSRVNEHLADFLRACASLDDRKEVNDSDYAVLLEILRPMAIEAIVSTKSNFESDRNLDSNMLAILTEYYTYGKFTIHNLSADYKLSLSQCYRIMAQYSDYWYECSKNPTTYEPSPDLLAEIKRLGIVRHDLDKLTQLPLEEKK